MQAAGVEVLLVGDTAAEVVLGLDSTVQIPPEFLLTLTAAVRRGAPDAFLMGDLPHACRGEGVDAAVGWSRRFVDEAGCDGVKVEVTSKEADLVTAMRDAGIPTIAHLGLLPQRLEPGESYRAQGRQAEQAERLLAEAETLERAGASILLLEAVASEVAREITLQAKVPVIGCCAGPHCDGTVVVYHDMIGLQGGHPPRAVKRYADLTGYLTDAFKAYVADIHEGRFPTDSEAIHMKPGEFEKFTSRSQRSETVG
jgi:3-methyl-2-oxobutanoate hydroxymethyltransferase